MKPDVVFEDKHMIIVNKPPGMPSQRDRSRDMDVLSMVERYCNKQGECALISRLDRPVGGLMLISKNSEATRRLSAMQQDKSIHKTYLALVEGVHQDGSTELTDYIMKTHSGLAQIWTGKTSLCPNDKRYKIAILTYEPFKQYTIEDRDYSLIYVNLKTGRFHQIRAQLSAHGMPLYGDTKYSSYFKSMKGWHQIGLCACKLDFIHPYTGEALSFQVRPDYFPISIDKHK